MHEFKSKVRVYPGAAAWYFVTLPKTIAREIDFEHGHHKAGFGSLRVKVTIGSTSWQTSIFTDTKSNSYMLPLKAEVRKAKEVCRGCVVREACLEYALANREDYGIWGGMSERERRRVLKRRRQVASRT